MMTSYDPVLPVLQLLTAAYMIIPPATIVWTTLNVAMTIQTITMAVTMTTECVKSTRMGGLIPSMDISPERIIKDVVLRFLVIGQRSPSILFAAGCVPDLMSQTFLQFPFLLEDTLCVRYWYVSVVPVSG